MVLCREHGFPYYLAWATIMQGWAVAALGQGEDGAAQMRERLGRATGHGRRAAPAVLLDAVG